MPSFDVVSEVNHHELSNAVDQANREVTTRFDFKGSDSRFELAGNEITGPALIEEHASTTVVQPGDELRVDELGNLQINIGSDRS